MALICSSLSFMLSPFFLVYWAALPISRGRVALWSFGHGTRLALQRPIVEQPCRGLRLAPACPCGRLPASHGDGKGYEKSRWKSPGLLGAGRAAAALRLRCLLRRGGSNP